MLNIDYIKLEQQPEQYICRVSTGAAFSTTSQLEVMFFATRNVRFEPHEFRKYLEELEDTGRTYWACGPASVEIEKVPAHKIHWFKSEGHPGMEDGIYGIRQNGEKLYYSMIEEKGEVLFEEGVMAAIPEIKKFLSTNPN